MSFICRFSGLSSFQDRASELYRPHSRKKKDISCVQAVQKATVTNKQTNKNNQPTARRPANPPVRFAFRRKKTKQQQHGARAQRKPKTKPQGQRGKRSLKANQQKHAKKQMNCTEKRISEMSSRIPARIG